MQTICNAAIHWLLEIRDGWNRFWFAPADPATYSLVRILAGAMLLYTHLVWTLDFEAFFGKHAWIPADVAEELFFTEPAPVPEPAARPAPVGPPVTRTSAGPDDLLGLASRAAEDEEVVAPPVGPQASGPAGPTFGPQPPGVDVENVPPPSREERPSPAMVRTLRWSHFLWVDSAVYRWAIHAVMLLACTCLMLGLCTRVAAVAVALLTISYVNRSLGSMFGLDQINILLSMYLVVGPAGACYSLDRWLLRRRGTPLPVAPSVGANIGLRLIQLHMCVIYFFAGTTKLLGRSWWDGYAMWQAFSNLEYQSLDMTWLVDWPIFTSLMGHVTILWEVSYFALIWPRLSRPVMLLLAVLLHLGIAFCLGMITFGLAMIIANVAFVPAWFTRALLDRGGAATADEPARQPAAKKSRRP